MTLKLKDFLSSTNRIDPLFLKQAQSDYLSPHFTAWELASTHRGTRLDAINYLYLDFYRDSAIKLCNELLEPIREHFGKPINVNSAMRWAEPLTSSLWEGIDCNVRPGGGKNYSPRSQHCRMEAVDFTIPGLSTREIWNWIVENSPNPFGQVIYEVGKRSSWIHISIPGLKYQTNKPVYGLATDAIFNQLGKWVYKTRHEFIGNKDFWGKQSLEQALSLGRSYRYDLSKSA